MIFQRYLVVLVLATTTLAGCGLGQPPPPTPLPFARHTALDVANAFAAAGLSVQNPVRDLVVGREAPSTFNDRYTFEIDAVAPDGGQILIFNDPARLGEWEAYVNRLRSTSSTRRDVVYTYLHHNVLLQLNANLLPDQAAAYRDALEGIG